MGCFPVQPINPLNEALLASLGENYYPMYAPQFQPADRKKMTNDKFLQYQTPGGGKIKPTADGTHKHIAQILTSVTGLLGSVFNFFAPLFLILDLLRSLVDIICAFFNPLPLILTVVEMFINVIPPIIALYPPLSSILHALNAAKLIIAIVGSLGSIVIGIIDQIVNAGLRLVQAGLEGDTAALIAIPLEICALIQDFANELGGLGPISVIIDLLDLFMSLSSQLFCSPGLNGVGGSKCCDGENCPPLIYDPPSGTGVITGFTIPGITIGDLVAPLRDVQLPNVFEPPITILDPPIDFGELSGDLVDLELGPFEIGPFEFPPLDLLPIPDSVANFQLTAPSMTMTFVQARDDITDLGKFVIHPDDLAATAPEDGVIPATIRFRFRRTDIPNASWITAACYEYGPLPFSVGLGGLAVEVPNFLNIQPYVNLYTDAYPPETPVEWELLPDEVELIKNNLISLGCHGDIRNSSAIVQGLVNESSSSIENLGNDADSGFAPLAEKVGALLPRPPIAALDECLAKQEADPTVSQAQCVFDTVTDYIAEVSSFTEDVVCIGSSPTGSNYTTNKTSVTANGRDRARVSLQVNDMSGTPLLPGLISENFSVVFSTTHGKLGPVAYDDAEGTFSANITAEEPGRAEVSAIFFVRDVECMRPATFDVFTIVEKILTIDFIRPGGQFPRRDKRTQYVQSGSRRRR